MIFEKLFSLIGMPPNPIKSWPIIKNVNLDFHTSTKSINSVKFGDPINNAQAFGRPSSIIPIERDYIALVYADQGLELEFERERLAYVAFLIGPDQHPRRGKITAFSQPILNSAKLTHHHSRTRIEETFGIPKIADRDDAEAILYYELNSLTIEFELSKADSLKRVNIYPTHTG